MRIELVEQLRLFDVDEQWLGRGDLEVSDMLVAEPFGRTYPRLGVERFARIGAVHEGDVSEHGLGVGMGAKPGDGLDEAAVQGIGGVAHHEDGKRIVEAVASGSFMA